MNESVVKFAMDFEKRGTNLYLELARKMQNPLSKKLFYSLAGQEVNHAKRIDFFYLSAGEIENSALAEDIVSVQAEIKEFFENSKDADFSTEGNLNGYRLALALEQEGYDAYKNFYEKTTDPKEKDFLSFLMQEEKNHIEAIGNVYFYLTGTSDWLEQEESTVWNWMSS